MALAANDVEIQRPCPVDLPEDFRGGAKNRHCGHCNKTVHLLSTLSEPEAQSFLAANEGKDICVTYLVGADGNIQFRPEPSVVPLSSLRRPRTVAAAAAVGLGLALAACAPHDNPRIETRTVVQTDVLSKVQTPTKTEPCETDKLEPVQMMAGGIGPVEPLPVVEPPPVKKIESRPPMRAGGLMRRPDPTPDPAPAPTMVRGGRG